MLTPTMLIGATIALTIGVALTRYRDTFHPSLVIGPMLAFHYFYSPLQLEATDGFYGYLWDEHVARAQWVHLAGVFAMCAGLLSGSRGARPPAAPAPRLGALLDTATLVRGSTFLAVTGIAGFVYGIIHIGGFSEAYGRAYGGGSAESGWVRELMLLCLPALLLFTISHQGRRLTTRDALIALAFGSPFLIHGLLGARRGPTFMGLAGPAMVFYMARDKRPRLLTLVVSGGLLGTLMLALVANRGSVYWGELDLERDPSAYFQPGTGNDFIYGAGLVIVTDETHDFDWGAAYATTLFVRPIPKEIWPTKYEDAARFFGRPVLEENLGVDVDSFRNVLGWTAAIGAAPGIVGDMWREFSWGMLVPLFGLGWFYAYAWRRAVTNRGAWVPVYCLAASLSLYLVMQTLEAMLYRFLLGVVPMVLILRQARRAAGRRAPTTVDAQPPLTGRLAR